MVLANLAERGLAAASGAPMMTWAILNGQHLLMRFHMRMQLLPIPDFNITIHPDNIRAVFNDPPDVVMTEVLNRFVQTISSVVGAKNGKSVEMRQSILMRRN
jgi:hypothetical protein